MNKLGLFLKKNSPTILTCIGAVGVVGTAVSAVKATPKARALLEEAEWNKQEDLTCLEKIRIAGPAYIPSILIGASTIACIFGANILNKRQQAALTSAYMLLDSSYKEYRAKVADIFGQEGHDRVVREISENKYKENTILPVNGRQQFLDFFSLQFFESTEEDIHNAVIYVNDVLKSRGYVSLGEFYERLGIPTTEMDYTLGWSKITIDSDYPCIEYVVTKSKGEDGVERCVLELPIEPSPNYMYF